MKIKIEGSIYFDPDSLKYQNHPDIWPPYRFYAFQTPTMGECTRVCAHTIETDIPDDFDPRPGMVKALREQRKAAEREFAAKVMEIDQRINSLLAIENAT